MYKKWEAPPKVEILTEITTCVSVLASALPQTTDYCDICNHKGCDNCVADGSNAYCVPSHYEPPTEREGE